MTKTKKCRECNRSMSVDLGSHYCRSCWQKARYNTYGIKPDTSHQQRLDAIKNDPTYYAFTEERNESLKKFYAKYGKNWYIFQGLLSGPQFTKGWIYQYKQERRGTDDE